MRRSRNELYKNIAVYILLSIATITLIFPFIWMLSGAFKNNLEVVKMPPQFLPSQFNFDNFIEIKKYFPIERFLLNSVFVSVTMTTLQLMVCSMAAFVFAKVRFKGRETLFVLYLITMMIPLQVRVTPIFIMFSYMGINNTYLGLILPGVFSAFGVFLLRQRIMTIPDSYLESAFIDGASYFKVYLKIIMPLSKIALATLAIFAFMYSWNDYLWPLIIINSTRLATMPLGLSKLTGRWSTQWNILMAGNVISFVPILIVFIFAQNYFIKGMTLGGIKG